jgi:predicted transcriptional regulator
MSEVKILVQGIDDFFADTGRAARRIDKGDRTPQPASISFTSSEEVFGLLTPNRWRLLSKLRAIGPSSIRALAGVLERDYRGVHADVTALIAAGLVERGDDAKVLVPWTRITAELSIEEAA